MKPISMIDIEFYLGCNDTKDLIPIYYYEISKQKYSAKTLYVGHITKKRLYEPDYVEPQWRLGDDSAWYRSFSYGIEYDETTESYGNLQKLPYTEASIEFLRHRTMLWLKDPDEDRAKQLLTDYYKRKLAKVDKRRDKLLATLAELR